MSPSKLNLDPGVVNACRQAAKRIAEDVFEQISSRTTLSVERSVTRLLGVDGADELEAPLPNVLVDHVAERGGLERGVAHWLGNAMLQTQRSPQQIAEAVSAGELDLAELDQAEEPAIRERVSEECSARIAEINGRFEERRAMRRASARPPRRCATCSRPPGTCTRTWSTPRPWRRPAGTSSR